MLHGSDSGLLERVVEEGRPVHVGYFYWSKKDDSDAKVTRWTYSLGEKEYGIIRKSCDTHFNSIDEQIRILEEGRGMGFNTPTVYVDKQGCWNMFDLTENGKYYLIDMGAGGVLQRMFDLKTEGDTTYFPHNGSYLCFEGLSNFSELLAQAPALMAQFRRRYFSMFNDPFMWLIKDRTALLYLIDVEDAIREKPETINDPNQSSYDVIRRAVKGDTWAGDPVLELISRKDEKLNTMGRIFLDTFVNASLASSAQPYVSVK